VTDSNPKKKIVIVGGGPAGMMAAIELSKTHEVHLFEKGKTLGRKFLVAGKGGFNITNSVLENELTSKYTPEKSFENFLHTFDTTATRDWLQELGIPTYIGSSGRIFPKKGIKPIEVLNVLKNRILSQGGTLYFEHEFIDFDTEQIELIYKGQRKTEAFDFCVFALGGGSWSVTGSKGDWSPIFTKQDIETKPFEASNCGLEINFKDKEIEPFIGSPLKNIRVSYHEKTIKGEAVISSYGLEGNAIYPISGIVREALKNDTQTFIEIDLKPFNTEKELFRKITETTLPKNYAYLFKLDKVQIALIKSFTDKETYLNPKLFVKSIKKIKIPIESLRSLEEAISSVGGIPLSELNTELSLKKFPNIYITGEMFDWDTITGGYLLQGCFSTGMVAAKSIISKIKNT
tara:strand:- start:14823 stop:16031 length:1209 start_codon:yes stop_codon:yes gene_type:complete